MKTKLFIFSFISIFAFASEAKVTEKIISIDPQKPVYLRLKTKALGPDLQCSYGLTNGDFLFPLMLNDEPLLAEKAYHFSQVFEFAIQDSKSMQGFAFISQIQCWILNGEQSTVETRSGEAVVEIFQNPRGPLLFWDRFEHFTRVSTGVDLWISAPRTTQKRIQIHLLR